MEEDEVEYSEEEEEYLDKVTAYQGKAMSVEYTGGVFYQWADNYHIDTAVDLYTCAGFKVELSELYKTEKELIDRANGAGHSLRQQFDYDHATKFCEKINKLQHE